MLWIKKWNQINTDFWGKDVNRAYLTSYGALTIYLFIVILSSCAVYNRTSSVPSFGIDYVSYPFLQMIATRL